MIPRTLWILIAAQIVLGAFDTLYHHELTERLAWRPSQRRELVLHAARNLLYSALFFVLGRLQPRGMWAIAIGVLLLVEVFVTLTDFVEEDRTRALPASERITHTLLALNYGAVLVLLIPLLAGNAAQRTGFAPVDYGLWSILASVASAGTLLLGLRDLAASRRFRSVDHCSSAAIAPALAERHTVLVTGATGFIGSRLAEVLSAYGHELIVLARDPAKAHLFRPPYTMITGLDQIPNQKRIDAIVNLAGEPIAAGLWTAARRQRILQSRLDMTRDVVRLIARLSSPPEVLVNASAIGWYGLRQDEVLGEDADPMPCFSHEVCAAWEERARGAERHGVRVVCLRIGLVLGTEGGLLGRMLLPFEFGLGGPIGSGRQWMSWIERDDLVRLILHVIARPDLCGAVNATAPHPVRNAEFTHELGHALHRPALLRTPGRLLHRLLGDFAHELLLGGQRVVPAKALRSGFEFHHPTLPGTLAHLLGRKRAPVPHAPRIAVTADIL
jgi:uncharacterized protein (TIGR01777 family)